MVEVASPSGRVFTVAESFHPRPIENRLDAPPQVARCNRFCRPYRLEDAMNVAGIDVAH